MTIKRPRQLTKIASGGDELYTVLFLWEEKKKKDNCFKDNSGLSQ